MSVMTLLLVIVTTFTVSKNLAKWFSYKRALWCIATTVLIMSIWLLGVTTIHLPIWILIGLRLITNVMIKIRQNKAVKNNQ